MSTKFFTNSNDNTLFEKFKGVFTYSKVAAFDALVGYFRSSGYFRIRQYLKEVNQIRILVGINVDNLIGDAAVKGLEFKFNARSAQLALAILLEHYGAPINAIEQYEDFMSKFITPLPNGKDFETEINTWKSPSLN